MEDVIEHEASVRGSNEHEELVREHAQLLVRVEQLELELTRYHEHAQRTSRLFLLATDYADSVRRSARRDGELALRKARDRAAKILRELETERRHAEDELSRLQALTDETRTRLATFVTAALHGLDADVESEKHDLSDETVGDLPDVLQTQLSAASSSAPTSSPSVGRPER
jgi:cell division septum initiation protein DivIVA